MAIAFFLNFLFIIILSVFPVYYQTKFFKLGWINPFTLLFLIGVPYNLFKQMLGPLFMLEKGHLDPYFNFSLLMQNVSLLVFCLILFFSLKICRKIISRDLIYKFHSHKFKRVRLYRLGWLFLIVFFISFFLVANHSYGVINWINHPRTGYQLHRSGVGHFYALSISMISVSYVLFTISAKRNISVIFISIAFISLVSLLGTKGFMLSFFTYTIIILWFRKYRHLKVLFIIGFSLVTIVMLLNFGQFDYVSIAKYFDHHLNSVMYYKAYFSDNLDLFYGKIWITDFWSLVPRSIFPEKPYVYGVLHVNEYLFPGAAESTFTPAFGGPIKAFADFGVLGVILIPLLDITYYVYILLTYLLYSNVNLNTILDYSSKIYLFLWLLAPAFLTFLPIPLNLVLFFLIVKTISIGSRVVVNKRN
jgi:oligosaccharide repeat unit polymerase